MDLNSNSLLIIKLFSMIFIYFLIIPLLNLIINSVKNNYNRNKRIKQEKDSDPLKSLTFIQKINRNKNFGLKEYSQKNIIRFVYVISIAIPSFISLYNLLYGIIAVIIMPFVFVSFNNMKIKKELNDRDILIDRMLKFKQSNMKLVDPKSNILNYNSEFEILEWGEDLKPEKIRLFIPVNFDPLGKDKFLADLSIRFGRGRPFEVDENDKDYPGWDTDRGVTTIKLEDPLPTTAMWKDFYINDPIVQWSFFPLGIGSKAGIPIKNPETGKVEHIIGYDVDGAQGDYLKKVGITPGADLTASPHSLGAGVTGGGKSVAQNNIINACLMRPKEWLLFGIDMKKVELGKLRRYGVPVATTYKDAADIATFVQKVMLERFEEMERRGINSWSKMPEEERGPAIMLMVDEVSELLAPTKGKSDEAKEIAELQDAIRSALESIARLGRAARVVMTIWGQRPDSEVVSMQIRQNCPTRLGAGNLPATISGMVFESTEGSRVPGNPKGRMLIKTHSIQPIHFQGFFADPSWINNYLESNGLPINVYEDSSLNDDFNSKKSNDDNLEDEMSDSEFDELLDSM